MDPAEIQELIAAGFDDAIVRVESDDNTHYGALVVASEFDGSFAYGEDRSELAVNSWDVVNDDSLTVAFSSAPANGDTVFIILLDRVDPDDRSHGVFADGSSQAKLVNTSWQSEDLVHWHAAEAPDLGGGAVRALSLHQYGFAAILAVTGEDGAARLYSSLDFARWRPVARTEGCGSVTPWYVYANYPSKVAEEQALFVVPADDPTRVCCRWGPDWPAAAGGDRRSVAARAPGPP